MAWTHAICSSCYAQREPGRTPTRVTGGEPEWCCYCGKRTTEGIYYRGKHEEVHRLAFHKDGD